MRARWTAGLAVLVAAAAGMPAGANQGALTVTSVTVGSSTLTVRGALALPAEAFAPVTVSTDGAGDARVDGTDLRDTTAKVTGWPTAPAVELTTALTAGGTPPLHGFAVPIDLADGRNLWLGAGTPGSNSGRTANWTGLCVITTGYSCATPLEGAVAATGVTWKLPIGSTAKSGSTIAAGSAYGSVPTSFAWPVAYVTAATAPHDSATALSGYVVPGGVEAVALPTSDGEPVEWPSTAAVKPTTGAYTVTVDKPAGPAPHTLWVRSCWGSGDAPTCLVTSRAL